MLMHWNYRMVRKGDYIEIHEVYYDADDKPVMVTENGIVVGGDTEAEVMVDMKLYLEAIARPVLEYDDIPGGYSESVAWA